MADPIIVELIGKIAQLRRAFEDANALMRRFEESANRDGARASKERVTRARREGDEKVRATEQWTRFRQRVVDNSAKMAGRIASQAAAREIREHARAEREKTRDTQRGERERRQEKARSERENTQGAAKAERERTADAKRQKQERDRQDRIQTNSARMAGRLAERESRQEERQGRASYRGREQFARRWTGIAGGSVRSIVGGATRLAGTALALGGGFTLADAMQSSFGAERAATALSNSAYTAEKGSTRPDPNTILTRARQVQATTGIDKAELIKGWQSYVAKSSDFKGGRANLEEMAKLAKGSGSDFGSVMSAAGWLRAQNPNMTPDEMSSTMRNIVGQGKLGAVEISDLAQIAGKVTASSAMYADTRTEADRNANVSSQTVSQRRLLGLSQIAIKTAGNPEEAATAVTRFGADVLSHGSKLAAAGLHVSDAKTGLLNDPAEILAQMFEKTGGHLGKLHKLGLGERSIKVAEALAPVYQSAAAMATGSDAEKRKAGSEAVRQEVNRYTSAGYSKEDVNRDFSAVMKTSAEKFDLAVKAIGEILQQKLQPYLSRLADALPGLLPKIERVIDGMAKLAESFLDNPLKGIGAVIAGKVIADLGMAAIGSAVKKALVSLVAGGVGSGTGAPGGAAGGMTGGAVAGGAVVGAAAFVGWEGYKLLDAKDAGTQRGKEHGSSLLEQAENAKTPEELDSIRKELADAHKRTSKKGIVGTVVAAQGIGVSTVESLLTGDSNRSLSAVEKYGHARAIEDNSEAIVRALEKAAERLSHVNDELVPLSQDPVAGNPAREDPQHSTRRGGHH